MTAVIGTVGVRRCRFTGRLFFAHEARGEIGVLRPKRLSLEPENLKDSDLAGHIKLSREAHKTVTKGVWGTQESVTNFARSGFRPIQVECDRDVRVSLRSGNWGRRLAGLLRANSGKCVQFN